MASLSNNITQAIGTSADANVTLSASGSPQTIITAPANGFIIANVYVNGFPPQGNRTIAVNVGLAVLRKFKSGANSPFPYDVISPNSTGQWGTQLATGAQDGATLEGFSLHSVYIPAGKSLTVTKDGWAGGSVIVCGQTFINTP